MTVKKDKSMQLSLTCIELEDILCKINQKRVEYRIISHMWNINIHRKGATKGQRIRTDELIHRTELWGGSGLKSGAFGTFLKGSNYSGDGYGTRIIIHEH